MADRVSPGSDAQRRVRVTLRRSAIGGTEDARRTVRALGLRRVGASRVHAVTPAVADALRQVASLVSVAEVDRGGLGDLRPPRGARRARRRVGRGGASGAGNTAGRGHKGQKARAGGGRRPGFEGGQLPLVKRVPYRRGIRGAGSNLTGGGPRPRMDVVNVGRLAAFAPGTEVTPASLRDARLASGGPVKILGGGTLPHALVVRAHAFSKSARALIEKTGGRAEVLPA